MKGKLIILTLLVVLIAITACQEYEQWEPYDPFDSPLGSEVQAVPEPKVESIPKAAELDQVCDWMGCRWFFE